MATPATPSAELRAGLRFAIQTLRKVKRRQPVDIDAVITQLEVVRLSA